MLILVKSINVKNNIAEEYLGLIFFHYVIFLLFYMYLRIILKFNT